MRNKNTFWLIACVMLIAAVAVYQQKPSEPEAPAATKRTTSLLPITVDIDSGAVENPGNLPVEVLEGPEDQWALLMLRLDGYSGARVTVHYRDGEPPGDWSLNIGDSRTNNGWAGDSGTQTHDSEVQIKGTQMSVWASDVMEGTDNRDLQIVKDFVKPGQTVEFEITNERVAWKSPQHQGELESPFLFALNGQPDQEGEVNRDIFVGINRVISGTSRSGYGVASVEVNFLPYE